MGVSSVLPVRKEVTDGVSISRFPMIKARPGRWSDHWMPSYLSPPKIVKRGGVNVDDQEGGEAIKGEGTKPIYAIQPSILKHKDGRLQILCRTRNAQVATAWSSDNGDTWSKVTLLDVPNNNSGTDAVTMKDGRHILIYNNFSTLPGTPKGPRTPLCVAVSEDGINWQPVLTLEDSPISQYSYLALFRERREAACHLYMAPSTN